MNTTSRLRWCFEAPPPTTSRGCVGQAALEKAGPRVPYQRQNEATRDDSGGKPDNADKPAASSGQHGAETANKHGLGTGVTRKSGPSKGRRVRSSHASSSKVKRAREGPAFRRSLTLAKR